MNAKIAIVHDWITEYSGAEKVLEQMLNVFPDADLYSTIDFLPENLRWCIKHKKVNTTFIQKLPFAKKIYRNYFPLMPFAIEQLDLSGYDIIISSNYAVAKGVLTHSEQLHVCYCHSPVRYAWDLYHQYMREANLKIRTPKGLLAKLSLHYLRLWDVATANKVDYFVANSNFIGKRIRRVYHRFSKTIYPPVNIESFKLYTEKGDYYITASRFVPYKKIDLIVEAFADMPDKKLLVLGDGPDFKKISAHQAPNIQFLGYQPFENLISYIQKSKGFVFAALEDFGIAPVEAMACGTPVIAFKGGGTMETVKDGVTGIFFDKQEKESLKEAILRFEAHTFDYHAVSAHAKQFSEERFRVEFSEYVEKCYHKFFNT